MTFLIMYWNSSSVYSRVGKGTILIFEGMKRIEGNFGKEGISNKTDIATSESPGILLVSVSCEVSIMKESKTCWSCTKVTKLTNERFTNSGD